MTQILIAEDEPLVALFLEKGLRKNGFDTRTAYDGNQALQMAEAEEFDLLLLDLGLPERDGLEVIHELRGRGENRPIIAITARSDDFLRASVLQAGANDYITKPFVFRDLLVSVITQLHHWAAGETSQ